MGTFDKYLQLADKTYFNRLGKVTKIVGLTIESVGPNAKLNDLCRIIIDREQNISTMAEVVGFRDKHLLLMPFESVEGIGVGCIVENTGHPLTVKVGEELLGHTLDGIGQAQPMWKNYYFRMIIRLKHCRRIRWQEKLLMKYYLWV